MTKYLSAALLSLAVAMPVSAQTGQQTGQQAGQAHSGKAVTAGPVNVRLTFFLIQGDGFTNDDAEIRPLVVELRKVFKFTGYRLASKSVLQSTIGQEGFAMVEQVVNDPDGQSYLIKATISDLTPGGHMILHVRLFPGTMQKEVTLIDASVSLSDGKTAILGSALGGKGTAAIILAVSPTIEK